MKNLVLITIVIFSFTFFSCQKEKISTGTAISDHFFLQSEGVNIPIHVRGNINSKKILLLVHGGPGDNAITYRTEYVVNNVEKEFAVVYYDQRYAGASQGNGGSKDITVFKAELKKVVELLKSRYGNNNSLYLFGHSWGGYLAPYYLTDGNNQDLFKGWIQVDGAHNYYLNDSLTREMLLEYGQKELLAGRNIDKWQPVVDLCKSTCLQRKFRCSKAI
jgi:pimeloyl-ACP methyl ester carboxylesterase